MTTSTIPPIALITGGSRGLGKSAALHIAKSGSDVILTYRSKQAEAEQVVSEIEALGRHAVALENEMIGQQVNGGVHATAHRRSRCRSRS